MNRSVSLIKGSDRMNLIAARGSSTQPGAVHNERSSQELENAADRPAGRPGSSSSGAEAIGTPSALWEPERDFRVLPEQVRRRDPCNVRDGQTQTFRIERKGMGRDPACRTASGTRR